MPHCQRVIFFGENAFFFIMMWIELFEGILGERKKYRM